MGIESDNHVQGEIVPVHPEDFPHIVEIWEAAVRATHLFLTEADIQFFKPVVLEALPQVNRLVCVRDSSGIAVGFMGVAADQIEMLFIHPQWRSRGLGRQLVEYAIHTCGATQVDVNEQNDQAVGFYRQMGFVVEGRSPHDSLGKPFPLLHMRFIQS